MHWRRFIRWWQRVCPGAAFGAGAAVMDSWRMGSSKAAMMDMAGEAESAQMDGAYEESAGTEYETETATAADGASAGAALENKAADELSDTETTQQKLVYTSRLTVDTTEFVPMQMQSVRKSANWVDILNSRKFPEMPKMVAEVSI